MPISTQPGPARIVAAHQRKRLAAVFSGRKRRKSTCSPICATIEKPTVAALPNSNQSKRPALGAWPAKPGRVRRASGSCIATAT
jgi:hypothetical protein